MKMTELRYEINEALERLFAKALSYGFVMKHDDQYVLDIQSLMHHYGIDEISSETLRGKISFCGEVGGEDTYSMKITFRKNRNGKFDDLWFSMQNNGCNLPLLEKYKIPQNLVEGYGGVPVDVEFAKTNFRVNELAISRLMAKIENVIGTTRVVLSL